ncbi:MAG: type II secretion system protein GspF [Gammaproteobacteria bacterium]|nr:MAG: type II secretion system protein GspF [Gammaproteobacteria bacterium]PIE37689.1 MAG: type II secretion system protein GspF [Gammaproteobacteria bacterium]
MAAFEYLALDGKGREKKGVLEADTARLARQLLRQQDLTPLTVSEAASRERGKRDEAGKTTPRFRGGISTNDLALLTRQIATLSSAGTPLEETLAAVSRQSEKPRVKSLLLAVRSRVLEGHSFASALKDYPRVFPEIYQATVAAGEQSGHLDAVLERLADYTEERQAANATIKKALIYPVMLVFASILIVAFLLAYVVPQVVQVFEGMDQELPALTRGMLASSDFVREWGIVVAGIVFVLVVGFRRALRGEGFKTRIHAMMLKLPLFKRLIRAFNSAQFARTLSILATSGVPVLEALDIASEVVTNRPMRQAVKTAAGQVREGATLAGSLERTGYFPPMLLHLIASGEQSGRLDSMLDKAATHQERELNGIMSVFLGLFEPVVILIMGGVVLTIVLGILLPIFEMNQLVG